MGREYISSRIEVSASGCWEWMASKNEKGYGLGTVSGIRSSLAHRISYEVFSGISPDGLSVCHKCDNPSCVNPEHLFLGTQKYNIRDASRKGRLNGQAKTHCKLGHKFTHENTAIVRETQRECLECRKILSRARSRRYRQRLKERLSK